MKDTWFIPGIDDGGSELRALSDADLITRFQMYPPGPVMKAEVCRRIHAAKAARDEAEQLRQRVAVLEQYAPEEVRNPKPPATSYIHRSKHE